MYIQTDGAYSIAELYAKRDNIGLSRRECKQPPRTRSLFEWGKAQQAYYLDNLLWSITSPPVVYIWEPVDGSGKGAVLDGRQRLKAIFSYLDGNYPLGKTMPGGWAGKTYNRLLATNPHLAETILETPIQVVTIQATSYWEATIAVYPQICGHTRKTVELEQQMLMHYLDDYGLDYRDPDCNIFTDKEYCDWEVSNLKMGIEKFKRKPPLSPHEYMNSEGWQKVKAMKSELRATEFVARHHHRGAIPC